jgi:hypothetical protein
LLNEVAAENHDFDGYVQTHLLGSHKFDREDKTFYCRVHNALQDDGENVSPYDKAMEYRDCATRNNIRDLPFKEQKPSLRARMRVGKSLCSS